MFEVKPKKYGEDTSDEIKGAVVLAYNNLGGKAKGKCIGVLIAKINTLEVKIIAISGVGTNDSGEAAKNLNNEIFKSKLSELETQGWVVAPMGQFHESNNTNVELQKIDSSNEEHQNFISEYLFRMERKITIYQENKEKLGPLMETYWRNKIQNNPNLENDIKTIMNFFDLPPETCVKMQIDLLNMKYPSFEKVLSNIGTMINQSPEKIKLALENKSRDEFVSSCKTLRVPEKMLNLLGSYYGHVDRSFSFKIGDWLVQCAEDNAVECLLKYLKENQIKFDSPIASVKLEWYSTKKSGNVVIHRDLCPFCQVRFESNTIALLEKAFPPPDTK